MSTPHTRRMAFLAGPFKGIMDAETGMIRAFERRRFEALIGHMEARGYIVDNAHRRESWGANFMAPQDCTRLDYENIRDCDLFVAFPGDPASPGTHIEIGWASALRKPMILLLEEGHTYAFLVKGLHVVSPVSYVSMPSGEVGLEQFATALDAFEARQPAGRLGGPHE
jgi:nucleoside 2-deoxyribosyltransferase